MARVKGHLQIDGDLKARNFPVDDSFYGITVKQTDDIASFSGINVLAFESDGFYITQNDPNTDEAIVGLRGSTGGGGISSITFTDGNNSHDSDTLNANDSQFYFSTNLSGQPVLNSIDS